MTKKSETPQFDELFVDAARIIVMNQLGSTSLLQRKLKIGFDKAGILVDQLMQHEVIGPFKGASPRDVYIKNQTELNALLVKIGADIKS